MTGRQGEIYRYRVYIPGCPPRPQALLYGLLLAMDRLEQYVHYTEYGPSRG